MAPGLSNGMGKDIDLSILIPVYKWDIRELLTCLHLQIMNVAASVSIEIIVVDDGSPLEWDLSDVSRSIPSLCYIKKDVNQGRSITRNQLLQKSSGRYVLFLDADMFPDHNDFLQIYLTQIEGGSKIISGGISYTKRILEGACYSFYLYKSLRTEALSAWQRAKEPWRYLFTSNICIQRELLQKVPFNEAFTGYGYEDIEWGLRLQNEAQICHIDNPCSHLGLLEKEDVLKKMHESISNYSLLLALHPEETKKSRAKAIAGLLQNIPEPILQCTESCLVKIFHRCSWNPLLFLVFQLDKMILLAESRKDNLR